MRRNTQDDCDVARVLAECDPAQTLDLSCRQVRPILAEYLADDAPMQPVRNLDQCGQSGALEIVPLVLRSRERNREQSPVPVLALDRDGEAMGPDAMEWLLRPLFR